MHPNAEPRRFHWCCLVAVMGLVLTLLLPAVTAAQGIEDRPGEDPATEEPLDEGTEEATEEPREVGTEEAPAAPPDRGTDEADLEDAGLVGTRSYESPLFNYTIDWSSDWEVDFGIEEIDGHPPVISDEEGEQDRLYLLWSAGPGEEAYAIFSGQTLNRGGPDGDIEEWTDQEWIDDMWASDFEVEALLDDTARSSAAVLYSVVAPEGNFQYYTVYQSIELEDGTTLYLTFSAFEDWFEDSYISWSEDVEINGEPVDVTFDWEDIEDAI